MSPSSLNWVIVSAFRNASAHQIDRWLTQCGSLRAQVTGRCRIVAVVGDCSPGDRTEALLRSGALARGIGLEIVRYDHGGPHFGSVESAQRMRQLSGVGNAMLNSVAEDDDLVFYVESDLIWEAHVPLELAGYLDGWNGPHVAAPLVFAGEYFYDVWGFRINGERFSPFFPYHKELGPGLSFVDSVGSCFVMYASVATNKLLRMSEGALVELCDRLRTSGHTIGVVPTLSVRHPA